MSYSPSISKECPYCITKCQFSGTSHSYCEIENKHHISYACTNCGGGIMTKWSSSTPDVNTFQKSPSSYSQTFEIYYPLIGDWKPKIVLETITEVEVKEDFIEAIACYNNGFYKSCMIMARRSIQQEMENKSTKGTNLYDQIESTGISKKLKTLLQKVKNFGNYGAHPDFGLYDSEGVKIDDKKAFAKLSLEFLDRYFSDEYEIDGLIESAPNSEKEIKQKVPAK